MNKKIKRQSVKKSKPKKISKKISKKKVGKGQWFNLEEDFKELLQFKQQGVQLTTTVDFTFKDGRKVGNWILTHKKELNKDQLDALGLNPAHKGKPIDKYMKLKEKYIKGLSSATSSSEKALLMNNLEQVEKIIRREKKLIRREMRKKIKGTGKKKSIKRGSGNGEQTAWMINPIYGSIPLSRKYEEAYGTFEFGEIAPVISQRVVYKKGKTPQKAEEFKIASIDFINHDEGRRKVVKSSFKPKTPIKID